MYAILPLENITYTVYNLIPLENITYRVYNFTVINYYRHILQF